MKIRLVKQDLLFLNPYWLWLIPDCPENIRYIKFKKYPLLADSSWIHQSYFNDSHLAALTL